jgi:hypothetical protein
MAKTKTSTTNVTKHTLWICEQLAKSGVVSQDAFVDGFSEEGGKTEGLRAEWYKLKDAIQAALGYVKVDISAEDGELRSGGLIQRRYSTPNFNRKEANRGKSQIGQLVAEYLKFPEHSKRSVFLGSGTTVFEVGEAMIEKGPYSLQQLFWTVNVALVSRWCEVAGEGKTPPVRKISIPGGQIEPEYFRFATMKTPGWEAVGIVVIGADGCLIREISEKRSQPYLFANSEDTAANTNTFIGLADHALVCCLTADKINADPETGPGPGITLPSKSSVRRILVTDKAPKEDVAALLRDNEWKVVWDEATLADLAMKTNREKIA